MFLFYTELEQEQSAMSDLEQLASMSNSEETEDLATIESTAVEQPNISQISTVCIVRYIASLFMCIYFS